MEPKVKSGNSVASFVLGILSILLSPIGVILGIIGLINGIVSRAKKQGKKGLGIAGIVLNSLGIILSIIVDIILAIVIGSVVLLGVGTAVTMYQVANAVNESGLSDTLGEIDWSQLDPNDLEGSMQTMMMDYAGETLLSGALEGIQSDEGLSVQLDGSRYTLKGDTLASIIVTNEDTGETMDIQEFLNENSEGLSELQDKMSDEYGMSGEDLFSMFESVSEGNMDFLNGDTLLSDTDGDDDLYSLIEGDSGDINLDSYFGTSGNDSIDINQLLNLLLKAIMDGNID